MNIISWNNSKIKLSYFMTIISWNKTHNQMTYETNLASQFPYLQRLGVKPSMITQQ